MVGVLVAPQTQGGDIGEVSATWLLVHRTDVQFGVLHESLQVHSKDVHHWNLNEQHFGGGLYQSVVPPVPACPVQEQSEHIHPFVRGAGDVLLAHLGEVIVDHHTVQGPALVGSGHLLSHGRHKTLRIEKAGHPEGGGSSIKHPGSELSVSLQQLSVPETNGGGVPGDLSRREKRIIMMQLRDPEDIFKTHFTPRCRHFSIIDTVQSILQVLKNINMYNNKST